MSLAKRIFNFYIFSNIHVALAAFCLVKITLLTYEIKDNLAPFFVFFSTIASYNFIRLYRVDTIQDWFFEFVKTYKKSIVGLTLASVLLVVYLAFSLHLKALIALIPFGFFTLFYVVPFPLRKRNPITLRSFAFVKLFLIAISWAGVTVLIPLLNYNIAIQQHETFTFIQRFLFVLVITLPFDIRDVNYDNDALKTLPQVFGVQQAKRIGLFFLMLFLGIALFENSVASNQFRIDLIIALLSLFFLLRANQNQHLYYSAFFVESLPIVWLIIHVWY